MRFSNEKKIGIMVTFIVGFLILLTVKAGNFQMGKRGYEIKVHLSNIDGVEINAPVRFNGLEKGVVKAIDIIYGEKTIMEVTLWLHEDVKLRQGAKVDVKNMGLMGEKYIGLTDGEAGAPFLKPGAILIGQEPVDFEKLLAKGDEIADNLKVISANIRGLLEVNNQAIDEIISNINVSARNIASISTNIDERLRVNKENIDGIAANLKLTSENLVDLSEDLKENPWKLLYKEKKKKRKFKK